MVYTREMSFVNMPLPRQRIHILMLLLPGFPDPFAVATINGEQTKTTAVIKRTLNPYWAESFDMYVDIRQGLSDRLTI